MTTVVCYELQFAMFMVGKKMFGDFVLGKLIFRGGGEVSSNGSFDSS